MIGGTPSLNAGRYGKPGHVRYLVIDAGEERLEPLLDVLDRLIGSTALADPQESSATLVIHRYGHIFTQEIYDIFCKDEKVYVMQDYSPRTLNDASLMDWFCLQHYPSDSDTFTRHLDPDGTFQWYTERTYEDILLSLRLLSAELTLGLIFLHCRGIVHLDIKLGNISVTPAGHVQICDFTMAVALPNLSQRRHDPDLSELGSMNSRSNAIMDSSSDCDCEAGHFGMIALDSKAFVTSKYAAPELLEPDDQGKIVFDTKADWWSLGSVLSELAYNTEDHQVMSDEGDFADFLCQTLSNDPQKRLTGFAAQSHPFFSFDAETWDEILDLRHPPCPGLPEVSLSDLPCDRVASESIHVCLTDTGSLIRGSQGHEFASDVDIGEDNQESEVQPFPSTASLYQQGVARLDGNQFEYKYGNQSLSDFGPALEDSVSSSVHGLECDEDDSIILIRSPCYYSTCSRISCVTCQEDWKELSKDEDVTLPQLEDGKTLVLDELHDPRGCKRFDRKRLVRTIAKSTERVMNRISRYISTPFRC